MDRGWTGTVKMDGYQTESGHRLVGWTEPGQRLDRGWTEAAKRLDRGGVEA